MDRYAELERVCREFDLLAVYLFGSRAGDGLALLAGEVVEGRGSDLDVGVIFAGGMPAPLRLGGLQVELEDLFAPLAVDLVPLQRVDALFQFEAIDGHRVAAPDPVAADYYELYIMRRAAELLPIERELEREMFGVSTI